MYGKLFAQMYDGTLATKGPWQALVTFQQLIILADQHGVVDMTPEAIARRTTIPLEIVLIGIAELERPDPDSRSPDEDGRRIVRLSDTRSWGWRIVNHGHYRKIRSEEERREYHKLYQRKRRAKEPVNQNVNTSTGRERSQPIAVGSKAVSRRHKEPRSEYGDRLVTAMNEELARLLGDSYLPVRRDQDASAGSAARLEIAGVPLSAAERHLRQACRVFNPSKHGNGELPGSLKYFEQGILNAWRSEPAAIRDIIEIAS